MKISINVEEEVIDYFKSEAISFGISYQTLMNLVLKGYADSKKKIELSLK